MITFESLMRNSKDEKLEEQYLCKECVPGERLLIRLRVDKKTGECLICKKSAEPILSIESLAKEFVRRTENLEKIFKKSKGGKYSATDVINRSIFVGQEECFQQTSKAVSSSVLQKILALPDVSRPFLDDSSKYEEVEYQLNISDLLCEWRGHEESLIKVNRYFNKLVGEYFGGILFEITNQGHGGCKLITAKTHSGCFFRARSYEAHDDFWRIKLSPSIELYAPKYQKSSPGRMNAKGVESLYLADSIKTAQAEVGGGKCLVARYRNKKKLKFLDFTKIESNLFERISPLDGDYCSRQKYRQVILNVIPKMLTQPVEDLGYVMTQAFCNYIATWEHWGKVEVHGVAYKSAKPKINGKNFLIFDPHSRVGKRRFSLDSIYKVRGKKKH